MKAAMFAVAALALAVTVPALAQGDAGAGDPNSPRDNAALSDYRHPDPQDRPPNVAYHPSGEDPYDNVPGYGRPIEQRCGPRDQACIASVSAEIWKRYPHEIATLCERETVVRNDQGFDARRLGVHDPAGAIRQPSPQTQALCQYGSAHGLMR